MVALDILGWVLVIALFIVGMAGLIFPILPGAVAIYFAFFVYGWFFSFGKLTVWFWIIQTVILIALIVADYVVSAWGTKKFGGSKLSVQLSTIGLIIGPFVIPAFGLILGPFIGAVIGELIHGSNFKQALKAGWGALVGLLSSTLVKGILQVVMIVVFIIWIV